ncbi:flavin reductase family protein [Aestuariivirga sp.]|jgi:flavin reductase (DIM6/NTAB) family NADH-FMN oxidoreductase RutF|uniref:flavin reductase family protein n=1 Tax=Aestuariivirga sp. TaxID=2650926 RepID=UPI00378369C5
MFYDAVRNDHGLAQDPFKAIVAPRPIAWISTLSPAGVANLAPYSFFNAFAQAPHYVAFGSGPPKDSLRNIEATGEFAVNFVTWDLREGMNATSAHVVADEFELAGLAKAPCRLIKAPRVAASPACLECRLYRIIPLPDDDGKAEDNMVIGRVIGIHIADRYIADGRVDTAAMQLIARLGYSEYVTVGSAWRMRRPD